MQSFYPSPSRQTWGFVLLVVLVLALHGLGLQSLWGSLALRPTAPVVQVRWHAPPAATAADSASAHTASPLASAQAVSPEAPVALAAPVAPVVPAAPVASVVPAAPAAAPITQAEVQPPTTVTEPLGSASILGVANAQTPAPVSATNPRPVASGSTSLTQAQFVWPLSVKLVYEFRGESKGIHYTADGEMVWRHNGNSYQLKQELRHLLLGARSQTSVGSSSPHGLLPQRFGDKSKQEVAAHFERDKGMVSFSANTPSQVLQDGAQDRLSLFVHLAGLMAGSPPFQQPGQHISFQVVSSRSAEVWAFSVDKTETLRLPLGAVKTIKLSRLPLQQYDQTVEMWLSPQHDFLPARVRIVQTNGDVLDQFLSKVQTP